MYNKADCARYTGRMDQLAYIRSIQYDGGHAAGLRALEVVCGELRFVVLPDRCLDISEASYRGVNLGFLSKAGLQSPRYARDTDDGSEPCSSLYCGLLFTCGLDNVGSYCEIDGRRYPMHGSLRATPAEHVCYDARWNGEGRYELVISGEMHCGRLFGEYLVLRRTLRCVLGTAEIEIIDELENRAFAAQPYLLLYHVNAGYPLLQDGSQVWLSSRGCQPRDGQAAGGLHRFSEIGEAVPNKAEEVFTHSMASDIHGRGIAAAVNPARELALTVRYGTDTLPRFVQWKSEAAGDYALGLEPTNADVRGRRYMTEHGDALPTLEPGEMRRFVLTLSVTEGADALNALRAEIDRLPMRRQTILRRNII